MKHSQINMLVETLHNGNITYFWTEVRKLSRQDRADLIDYSGLSDHEKLRLTLYIVRGFTD